MTLRLISLLSLLLVSTLWAGQDKSELEQLLHRFMAGASVNDAAMHDRFWAEELVYTSSSGTRFGKSEIMQGLPESDAQAEPAVTYTAEDVFTRVYGETAVITFRLVGKGSGEVSEYFNTGTFRLINGEWKAVAWQATRIPLENGSD